MFYEQQICILECFLKDHMIWGVIAAKIQLYGINNIFERITTENSYFQL